MAHRENAGHRARLANVHAKLIGGLVKEAYPRWAHYGIDPKNGGFIEALGQDGLGLPHPRRARVHPRQIYAFGQAQALGWSGDVTGIVSRAMEYFTAHYRRSDGLFRTLAAADGTALDERALLYDQAFALLGLAAAATALGAHDEFEERAVALRETIESHFSTAHGSLRSAAAPDPLRASHPHLSF